MKEPKEIVMLKHIDAVSYKNTVETEINECKQPVTIMMNAAAAGSSRFLREIIVQTVSHHKELFDKDIVAWVRMHLPPDWAKEPFGDELVLDVTDTRHLANIREIAKLIMPPVL